MIIAATSDLHLPKNYPEFMSALDRMKHRPDLFLIAGDVVQQSDMSQYDKFYNLIFGKFSCPVFACFGNNEFGKLRDELKTKYRDIKFLDDEAGIVTIGGQDVGVFGTTGSLDNPTPWQEANIPNIENVYKQRVEVVDNVLKRDRKSVV